MGAILEYKTFVAFGYVIGTAVPDRQLATLMTPITIVPMLLFAGFFIKQDNIPKWLWWFREISFFKYGYQIQFLNEFEGLEIECMNTNNIRERCDPLGDFDSP